MKQKLGRFVLFVLCGLVLSGRVSHADSIGRTYGGIDPVGYACGLSNSGPIAEFACLRSAYQDQNNGLTAKQAALKICPSISDPKKSQTCSNVITLGPRAAKNAHDMDFANYQGENLDMTDGSLDNVDFTGANLKAANFSGSTLNSMTFVGANLESSQFEAANISGADFRNANLRGTNFKFVKWQWGHLHDNWYLTYVDFRGADLRGTDFTGFKNGYESSRCIKTWL